MGGHGDSGACSFTETRAVPPSTFVELMDVSSEQHHTDSPAAVPPTPPTIDGPAPPSVPHRSDPRARLITGITQLRVEKERGMLREKLDKARAQMASTKSAAAGAAGAGAGAGAGVGAGAGAPVLPAEELAKLATVDVKPAELVEPSKLADAHPFLHYYGMLTHQMNMLQVRAHSAPCACWRVMRACRKSVSHGCRVPGHRADEHVPECHDEEQGGLP